MPAPVLIDLGLLAGSLAAIIFGQALLSYWHGFVSGKTGSDDAAGGCFVFRAVRVVSSRPVTGVVLGQRHGSAIPAALAASRGLVDRVIGAVAAEN